MATCRFSSKTIIEKQKRERGLKRRYDMSSLEERQTNNREGVRVGALEQLEEH